MPTFAFRDADGNAKYIYVDEGDGSSGDPFDVRSISGTGLDTIDTDPELLAYQFRQNTSGTAITPLTNNWLLRALNGLNQILAGRLGANSDVASASGSIHAKLGILINSLAPTLPTPVAYRTAVAVADLLAPPTVGTVVAGTVGGTLTNVPHGIAVVGVNAYGRTARSAVQTFTPANGTIRIPLTSGSFTHFDLFLSTSTTNPLFVGRVTVAQVVAGDTLTAAVTPTSAATFSGSGTPGSIDVRVQGIGPASTTIVGSSAFVLPSPIDCTGKDYILFDVELTGGTPINGFGATLVPFFLGNGTSYFQGDPITLSFASGLNGSRQRIRVDCFGSVGVALAVQNITGLGSTLNIWRTLR